MKIGNTILEIVRGSVLDQEVEAIVNAANTSLRGGGGVDGAIHRAAGKNLMGELIEVAPHGTKTGTAVITGGHDLKQKHVIHTPGPWWNGGKSGEREALAACYRSCLERADETGLTSLAFCSIATGVYRFPLELAAPLALSTVKEYLDRHRETSLARIVFAMFLQNEYAAFKRALNAMSEPE